jgi:hypothetical protein
LALSPPEEKGVTMTDLPVEDVAIEVVVHLLEILLEGHAAGLEAEERGLWEHEATTLDEIVRVPALVHFIGSRIAQLGAQYDADYITYSSDQQGQVRQLSQDLISIGHSAEVGTKLLERLSEKGAVAEDRQRMLRFEMDNSVDIALGDQPFARTVSSHLWAEMEPEYRRHIELIDSEISGGEVGKYSRPYCSPVSDVEVSWDQVLRAFITPEAGCTDPAPFDLRTRPADGG